jgi:hypothetical protein
LDEDKLKEIGAKKEAMRITKLEMADPKFKMRLKNRRTSLLLLNEDANQSDLDSQLSSNNSARISARSYHSSSSRGSGYIHRAVLKEKNHTELLRQRYDEEKKRDVTEVNIELNTLE